MDGRAEEDSEAEQEEERGEGEEEIEDRLGGRRDEVREKQEES